MIAVAALAAAAALAGTYGPAAERGAFLTGASAARAAAMGGAFAGVADDASAAASNPGGLGQLHDTQVLAQRDVVTGLGGLDGVGAGLAAAAFPLPHGVAGLAVATMSYGDYQERDAYGAATGPGNADDLAVRASWAALNPAWVGRAGWTGAAVEVVREGTGGAVAGASLGGLVPVRGDARIGWALEHVSLASGGFVLPATARLGASFREARSPVPLRIAGELSHAFVPGRSRIAVGAEAAPWPVLALRAGYRWQSAGDGVPGLEGVTAGLGIRLGGFGVDWAWEPKGDLAVTHRVAVTYAFAPAAPSPRRHETLPEPEPVRAPAQEEAPVRAAPAGGTVPADSVPPDPGSIGVPHVPGGR